MDMPLEAHAEALPGLTQTSERLRNTRTARSIYRTDGAVTMPTFPRSLPCNLLSRQMGILHRFNVPFLLLLQLSGMYRTVPGPMMHHEQVRERHTHPFVLGSSLVLCGSMIQLVHERTCRSGKLNRELIPL